MALLCLKGHRECDGCSVCTEPYGERCDICGGVITDGEEYYKVGDSAVCRMCAPPLDKMICDICKTESERGIMLMGLRLCTNCGESFVRQKHISGTYKRKE